MNFVYVFNKEHAEILIADGYTLMSYDGKNTWQFLNRKEMVFSAGHDFPFVLSNVMSL